MGRRALATRGRRPLVAGNWKMNGLAADGLALAKDVRTRAQAAPDLTAELLVCPPATLLRAVAEALAGGPVAVGGQDCHARASGAFTGDVSAAMLADAGASHVVVGHSERRQGLGEDDALIRAKAEAVLAAGLTAVVCIGETEAERDAGQTFAVLSTQLEGSLPAAATAANTVVAYEPVWAIGTGRTPTNEQIADAHEHIRNYVSIIRPGEAEGMRILYGGSVKPANAAEILALAGIDGALVGGASLKAEDFWAIAENA